MTRLARPNLPAKHHNLLPPLPLSPQQPLKPDLERQLDARNIARFVAWRVHIRSRSTHRWLRHQVPLVDVYVTGADGDGFG